MLTSSPPPITHTSALVPTCISAPRRSDPMVETLETAFWVQPASASVDHAGLHRTDQRRRYVFDQSGDAARDLLGATRRWYNDSAVPR